MMEFSGIIALTLVGWFIHFSLFRDENRSLWCYNEQLYLDAEKHGWEELPHVQGVAAVRAQEGQEELLHVQGQEGQPREDTPHSIRNNGPTPEAHLVSRRGSPLKRG